MILPPASGFLLPEGVTALKKWVITTAAVVALGLFFSLIRLSVVSYHFESPLSLANGNAKVVFIELQRLFTEGDEAVSGVFTGELSHSDPIGGRLPEELYVGYYYVTGDNSEIVQCYWSESDLSGKAEDIAAAADSRVGLIGGYPEPVTEKRTGISVYEIGELAFKLKPLLYMLGIYALALLLRPAVKAGRGRSL